MNPLFDFLPVALFVAVYVVSGDIYAATKVLMVATVIHTAVTWLVRRRIGAQLWLVLGVSMVFGSLTLLLHDKQFLFWKPTVINWLFAVILAGGVAIGRNPLRALLGKQLSLPPPVWRNLALGWAIGCLLEGALNLFIAYNFSEAFWVGFKLWGGFATTVLLMGASALYLVRGGYLDEDVGAPAVVESNESDQR